MNQFDRIAPLLRRWWTISRGLTVLVVVNVGVLAASIVGRIVDDQTVANANVWDKPAKFALSFLLFGPTLLWLFGMVERSRWVRRGLGVLGWSMVLEVSLITFQSARGRASHFNNETSFDAWIFQAMAAGVGIFTIAGIVVGIIMARRRLRNGMIGLATKLAVPLMTAGAVLGFVMTQPKSGQDPDDAIVGGHTNGADDGGPGLAFLGWSTEAGDYRVAHFLGLHSLQIVPLLAVGVMAIARHTGTAERTQRRVVILTACAWAGVVATAFVQAARELPFSQFDAVTGFLFVIGAVLPASAAIALLRWGPTTPAPERRADVESADLDDNAFSVVQRQQ